MRYCFEHLSIRLPFSIKSQGKSRYLKKLNYYVILETLFFKVIKNVSSFKLNFQ